MYLKGTSAPLSIKRNRRNSFKLYTHFLQDSKGNLWFGSFQGGISYYDSRNRTFRSISLMGQSNQDVRTIYEDSRHNIWVGYSGGIIVLNPLNMEIIRHYHTGNSELHSNFVRAIAQDERPVLDRYFRRRTWSIQSGPAIDSNLRTKEGFCSNTINQIIQDRQKRMWMGTGRRTGMLPSTDALTYKTYQRKDGLLNTNICAITER